MLPNRSRTGRSALALALALCVLLPAAAQSSSPSASLTYGPVLTRRPPGMDAGTAAGADAGAPRSASERPRSGARRHPARQDEGPMAPRPRSVYVPPAVTGTVPVPPPAPAPAPRPVVPGSTLSGSCQGGLCVDAAGNSMNAGGTGVGVGSGGRLCVRGGATVQCF